MATRIGKALDGRVAVVTGASSGIGAASARLFAAAGARVVVGYNKGVERANAVVGGLAGRGHKAMYLPLEDSAQIRKGGAGSRGTGSSSTFPRARCRPAPAARSFMARPKPRSTR